MIARGLLPDFSPQALAELNQPPGPSAVPGRQGPDLRHLPWCSIDNDDSRDLDQLTAAEALPDGCVKILVAVADVVSLVKKGSAIDGHAHHNTTTVYTEAKTFPMLPDQLSTDWTSLNYGSDRSAVIVEIVLANDASLQRSDVYVSLVRNQAKLAYNSVAAWLEGRGPLPNAIRALPGLAENLRLQDRVAQEMKRRRHLSGALTFETMEPHLVFDGDELKAIQTEERNRAKEIIEDFMISANGVTARFLAAKALPSLRRVVRTPEKWPRIVELAAEHHFKLPEAPDARALGEFLTEAREADPLRFPDLSVSIIKLIGPGEYAVEFPGGPASGHFSLAVRDYSHSTAPNRRYSDLVTQRLLRAAVSGSPPPYENGELSALASHCTEQEDAARKVERQVKKSAAAMLLQSRIGEQFDAIVTGAASKGTWVRILNSPYEGKLISGFQGLQIGVRLRVRLVGTDVERGFIDFEKAA